MDHERKTCDYCGLSFVGAGYSPDSERHYCCYGCFLVERMLGSQGDEGIASWIIIRLGIGAFLAMNVMMISLILYTTSANDLGASTVRGLHFALLILSTPAIVILGSPFIWSAVRGLLKGKVGMDALIISSSLTAYGASTVNTVRNSGHVYFDTATMLLTLVTAGKLLEASAKSRTSRSIKEMTGLVPERAAILLNGEEQEIPLDQVAEGDLLIVKPGGRIPTDGRIVSGSCFIQEAAFTGESRPRRCNEGDRVYGGSVNCDGFIKVQATAVGSKTLIAQIQQMVHEALERKAPVERLAERVSSFFTPAVWLAAIGTALYWGICRESVERGAMSALAVMVVACPCSLGIATPLATCLAIGKAAGIGVLIRSGEVLEKLPSVKRIYFDKTGTLTTGELSVCRIKTVEGVNEDEALAWAASIEAGSEHAVGKAITRAAKEREIGTGSVSDFKVFPGKGVAGTVTLGEETRYVTVGTYELLKQKCNGGDMLTPDLADNNMTVTYAGWDGSIKAAIYLQDFIREEAYPTVKRLLASGMETIILSGDREGPTGHLANELGVTDFISGCSPSEKITAVKEGQKRYPCGIAMVGDGINDAPALTEADVGVATGGGTDLARQASDVTLLGDELQRIPWTIELARTTYKIIRQNLYWAFGYNCAAMVLAFFGFVHPLIAASAMLLSSVAVLTNSLRINR